jgi:hypothetical protein
MCVQSHRFKGLKFGCPAYEPASFHRVNAKLVGFSARGNVSVSVGFHIGVHPNRNGRDEAQFGGNLGQHFEFTRRFDVERADSGLQALAHLLARLAYPGEDYAAGREAHAQGKVDFAAGHDIRTRA